MATHFIQQRALSGADAVSALRPFYFAVHPDFFGQYPRERVCFTQIMARIIVDCVLGRGCFTMLCYVPSRK